VPARAAQLPLPAAIGGIDAEIERQRSGALDPAAVGKTTVRHERRDHLAAVLETAAPEQRVFFVRDPHVEAAVVAIRRNAESAREAPADQTGHAATAVDRDAAVQTAAATMQIL
jgi:hypothetical protein